MNALEHAASRAIGDMAPVQFFTSNVELEIDGKCYRPKRGEIVNLPAWQARMLVMNSAAEYVNPEDATR